MKLCHANTFSEPRDTSSKKMWRVQVLKTGVRAYSCISSSPSCLLLLCLALSLCICTRIIYICISVYKHIQNYWCLSFLLLEPWSNDRAWQKVSLTWGPALASSPASHTHGRTLSHPPPRPRKNQLRSRIIGGGSTCR